MAGEGVLAPFGHGSGEGADKERGEAYEMHENSCRIFGGFLGKIGSEYDLRSFAALWRGKEW